METFVVRVWLPADGRAGGDALDLTGCVEYVGSGSSGIFHSSDELLALIRSRAAPGADVVAGGERDGTGRASTFARGRRTS